MYRTTVDTLYLCVDTVGIVEGLNHGVQPQGWRVHTQVPGSLKLNCPLRKSPAERHILLCMCFCLPQAVPSQAGSRSPVQKSSCAPQEPGDGFLHLPSPYCEVLFSKGCPHQVWWLGAKGMRGQHVPRGQLVKGCAGSPLWITVVMMSPRSWRVSDVTGRAAVWVP